FTKQANTKARANARASMARMIAHRARGHALGSRVAERHDLDVVRDGPRHELAADEELLRERVVGARRVALVELRDEPETPARVLRVGRVVRVPAVLADVDHEVERLSVGLRVLETPAVLRAVPEERRLGR